MSRILITLRSLRTNVEEHEGDWFVTLNGRRTGPALGWDDALVVRRWLRAGGLHAVLEEDGAVAAVAADGCFYG